MTNRKLVLLLVGCLTAAASCAEIVGAIAARASQPTRVSTPAPAPTPAWTPTPTPAPQAPVAPTPTLDHLTVEHLRVDDWSVDIAGHLPATHIAAMAAQAPGQWPRISAYVGWCLFDQVGAGLCLLSESSSPAATTNLEFRYSISREWYEAHPPVVQFRRPGVPTANEQQISAYMLLGWLVPGDIELDGLGARGRELAIRPSGGGWAVNPAFSGLECLWVGRAVQWAACSNVPEPHAGLLIEIGGSVDDLVMTALYHAGADAFFEAFPNVAGMCDRAMGGVPRAVESLETAMAAPTPEELRETAELAEEVNSAWGAIGQFSQFIDPATFRHCGWEGLTTEQTGAAFARLVELAALSADVVSMTRLEWWTQGTCAQAPDLCEQMTAILDEQKVLADAVLDLESAAEQLAVRCGDCRDAVAYDNQSLLSDCQDGFFEEACRRLRRIVDNRCSAKCAPFERCEECYMNLGPGLDFDTAPRLAARECERECR